MMGTCFHFFLEYNKLLLFLFCNFVILHVLLIWCIYFLYQWYFPFLLEKLYLRFWECFSMVEKWDPVLRSQDPLEHLGPLGYPGLPEPTGTPGPPWTLGILWDSQDPFQPQGPHKTPRTPWDPENFPRTTTQSLRYGA